MAYNRVSAQSYLTYIFNIICNVNVLFKGASNSVTDCEYSQSLVLYSRRNEKWFQVDLFFWGGELRILSKIIDPFSNSDGSVETI